MKTKLFRRILLKNLKYLKNYCLSGAKTEIPGVSEWLLDNIHLIEQNGCNAAEYFKKIKQLPQENEEIRIYRICRDALDGAALGEKLIKYLSEQPDWLESRELSSIPSMVVYCAIENAVSALKDHNEKLMASSVKSLFALKELNIEEIICRFSVCEKILSKDPVGEYTRMTDETKAYYRDQCAMLAQKAKMSEEEYANLILERARAAKSPAQRHVGYYLIENTEEKRRLKKKGWLFIGTRIFAPFVASSLISWLTGYWWLGWFIYIPLHEILRPIIERLFMIHTKPYFMPRMNIGDAIPPGAETLVTVSNLVPSPQNTREVCAHLEELMKANENGEIKFCLLADLKEAKVPRCV